MNSLKAIVANSAGGGEAGVDDGRPALQTVVMITVKQVRSTYGNGGAGGFDGGERGMIIHNIVGEEDFLMPAAAHVERGRVVKSPRSANQGKEDDVLAVPEAVLGRGSRSAGRRGRSSLPGTARRKRSVRERQIQAADRRLSGSVERNSIAMVFRIRPRKLRGRQTDNKAPQCRAHRRSRLSQSSLLKRTAIIPFRPDRGSAAKAPAWRGRN